MNDPKNLLADISSIIEEMNQLKKNAYNLYSTMVDDIIQGHTTDETAIERVMDGLIDFGDDEEFINLYRTLCRHVYYHYPQLVGEHVSMFLASFMTDEDTDIKMDFLQQQ